MHHHHPMRHHEWEERRQAWTATRGQPQHRPPWRSFCFLTYHLLRQQHSLWAVEPSTGHPWRHPIRQDTTHCAATRNQSNHHHEFLERKRMVAPSLLHQGGILVTAFHGPLPPWFRELCILPPTYLPPLTGDIPRCDSANDHQQTPTPSWMVWQPCHHCAATLIAPSSGIGTTALPSLSALTKTRVQSTSDANR